MAYPKWIPATVLAREIGGQGYRGGMSQLRAFLRPLRPAADDDPVVRFETAPGNQRQVDWGYLRHSFYVPLVTKLKQAGVTQDVVTANAEVRRWLQVVANVRTHGTTQEKPAERLIEERAHLQAVPPWRGDIAAARPSPAAQPVPSERPVAVIARLEAPTPQQPALAVYEQLLAKLQEVRA